MYWSLWSSGSWNTSFPIGGIIKNLGVALDHLWTETIWPHFWAIQIWLVCLFFVYVSFREFARAVGEERFFKMFLGIERETTDAQPE